MKNRYEQERDHLQIRDGWIVKLSLQSIESSREEGVVVWNCVLVNRMLSLVLGVENKNDTGN